MRTTVDLPDDLHRAVLLIARDRRQSLSRTVSDLLRAALEGDSSGPRAPIEIHPDTGFPLVRVGHRITDEDVAGLDNHWVSTNLLGGNAPMAGGDMTAGGPERVEGP
ncbi:MAG: hypothetical protein ACRCY8_09485 [Dermatophilaceae bacterium]